MTNSMQPRPRANRIPRHDASIHSDLAIPPGEYLAEVISEIGMDKTKMAAQLCLSATEMDALLTGDLPLTQVLVRRLDEVTMVPANIWLGLEAEYRLTLTQETKDERQNDETAESGSL